MQGTFERLDDLPLDEASLWLYTSQWDGLPTILLEVGLRKIPLVAAWVGGTVDVISEGTAWPVDKFEDAGAYVLAIRAALSDPSEAAERAGRLHALLLERHNRGHYERSLQNALSNRVAGHG
jgi:glycosyltransferase involved in cell wall biosynthesis